MLALSKKIFICMMSIIILYTYYYIILYTYYYIILYTYYYIILYTYYYIILYTYYIIHLLLYYIIHLLERTETNIILIWSGKVILGDAKPSPNITLPDQINMILGEVLSNKCFIIPATCVHPVHHTLLIQTRRPFTRYHVQYAPPPVQVCVLRHLFSNIEFYCV